jgi:hypothetical protein
LIGLSTDVRQDLLQEIENIKEILNAQFLNKTVSPSVFEQIDSAIHQAQFDLAKQDIKDEEWPKIIANVSQARSILMKELSSKPYSTRWISLYAVHIWLGLLLIAAWIFYSLLTGWPHLDLPLGVSSQVIIWGAAGGTVYSAYWLRNVVWNNTFSNANGIYYLAYPFAGAIFGSGLAYVAQAGLLAYGTPSTNSPYLLFAIAFLSGFFQDWAVTLLQSVSEAIHPSKGS